MATIGTSQRVGRKKHQRTRFNQRMTLHKLQLGQGGDQLETKIPTLSSTNGQ